jgi:enamine deaminase RidA (YjgF/YER057c/UK114 family)
VSQVRARVQAPEKPLDSGRNELRCCGIDGFDNRGWNMRKIERRRGVVLGLGLLAAAVGCVALGAEEVVRTALPDGNPFPISAAVTVPAGFETVYVSGALPSPSNKDAPKGTAPVYGDMEAQTVSVLTSIKGTLAKLGLGMGDVVKMTVFMTADPASDNRLNFAGLMAGYSQFFGTKEQPNKPARSAVQVAALVAPGALLEIEVIAAKRR